MKALRHHCHVKWILLYVERWLKAPMQNSDGSTQMRDKGTPQGGVVSPLLANLFLHYAFDAWVRRTLPTVPFCRYADDGLLHCCSRRQAEYVLRLIEKRFRECGLAIHPEKSGMIYCKKRDRFEQYERISFDFLGYTFKPRRCVDKQGVLHPNFLPAMSRTSKKEIHREIRSWHLQLRTDKTLEDLSRMFNPVIRGWFNYYGRFCPSAMHTVWVKLNQYLERWVRRKYKRFKNHKTRARKYLTCLAKENPHVFTHWKLGVFPMAVVVGAG